VQNTFPTWNKIHYLPATKFIAYPEQNHKLPAQKLTPIESNGKGAQNARPSTRRKIHHFPGAKSLATRLPTRSRVPWLSGESNSYPGAKCTATYPAQNTLLTRSKTHYLPGANTRPPTRSRNNHLQWQRAQNARPPTRRKIHHQNHKLPGAALTKTWLGTLLASSNK
jgi:hypothetical protein